MKHRQLLGWIAVTLSTVAACFWAFWGITENFHEGWYYSSLWRNVGLMLVQYLLLAMAFVAAAVMAIRWPRIGAAVHFVGALCLAWFFRGASPKVIYPFVIAPLTLMGGCYWIGRPQPRKWAAVIVTSLPLITIALFGAEPAYRLRAEWTTAFARRVISDRMASI